MTDQAAIAFRHLVHAFRRGELGMVDFRVRAAGLGIEHDLIDEELHQRALEVRDE